MRIELQKARRPYFVRGDNFSELFWWVATEKPLYQGSELPLHHRIRAGLDVMDDGSPRQWVKTWCNRWYEVGDRRHTDTCETACELCEYEALRNGMVSIKELAGADVLLATGREMILRRINRNRAIMIAEDAKRVELDGNSKPINQDESQPQWAAKVKAPTVASLLAILIKTPGDSITISMPNADKRRKFEYLQSATSKLGSRRAEHYDAAKRSVLAGLLRLQHLSQCLLCGERVCSPGRVKSKKGAYHAECLIRKAEDAGD